MSLPIRRAGRASTEIPAQSHAEELLAELIKIPVFQDQPREELLWFISVSEERRAAPGEIVMREGDAPDYMLVMLEGEMRARAEHGPVRWTRVHDKDAAM